MTVIVSDSFNRTNNTSTVGTTDSYAGGTNTAWTVYGGETYGIKSNQLYQVTTTKPDYQFAGFNIGTSNVKITATFANMPSSGDKPYLVLRATDSNNYLFLMGGSGATKVYELGLCQNGGTTWTTLALSSNSAVNGDVTEVTLNGNSIIVKINGTQVINTTTASQSTGTLFGLCCGAQQAVTFDNFIVEDLNTGQAYTKSLSDTLAASDSITKQISRYKSLSDSVNFSETLTKVLSRTKTLTETFTLTDSFAKTSARFKAITDSIGNSDSLSKSTARYKSLADTVAFGETFTSGRLITKSLTDSISSSESVTKRLSRYKSLTDSISSTDSISVTKTGASTGILTSGLVGYWNYKQDLSGTTWNNIAPTTAGNYSGTLMGGASIQAGGVYLDGIDGNIRFPNLVNFSSADQAFTVEISLNLARLPSSAMESSYILGSDDSHTITVDSTGFLRSYFDQSLSYAAGIVTGTTFHIAIVYDTNGYSQKIFFNGVQVANTSSTSVTEFATANYFYLGADLSMFYPYWTKGTYKFLRIYNRALSGAEINQNYQFGEEIGLPLPTASKTFTETISISDSPATVRKNVKMKSVADSVSISESFTTNHFMGPPWYLLAMKASEYWNRGLTGKGIKVGVVDTGIGYHEGLTVSGGYDTFPTNKDYRRDDSGLGHGTKTASLIAGKLTPYYTDGVLQGYAGGIAPGVTLYSLKVEDLSSGLADRIHSAFTWAIDNDLDILNISLKYSSADVLESSYFDDLKNHGILVIAGAGNGGEEITPSVSDPYPRSLSVPVVVTGLNSSMGTSNFDFGSTVDFIAPSRDMTTFAYSNPATSNGVVQFDWGTSFGVPLVTGVFALYKQAFPTKTWDEIFDLIKNSTLKIDGQTGWDKYRGWGLPEPSTEILALPYFYMKDLSESIGFSDAFYKGANGSRTVTETINILESIRKALIKNQSDNVVMSEVENKKTTKQYLDTLTQSDTMTSLKGKTIVLSDNVTIVDSLNKIINKLKTDFVGLLDELDIPLNVRLPLYDVVVTTEKMDVHSKEQELFGTIHLQGSQTLHVYLVGRQQLHVNLTGKQALNVNLKGVVQ
jgi:hypothetical protein